MPWCQEGGYILNYLDGIKRCQVVPATYKSMISEIKPDIVFAQGDTCIGNAPHSQKRLTKEIERSCTWLLELLSKPHRPSNIFLTLVGGESPEARSAFSRALLEPPDERERKLLEELANLDSGIFGYTIDLAPLRLTLSTVGKSIDEGVNDMIEASLKDLSANKPRLATSTISPFEVLRLVDQGVDLFDVQWALNAAQWGVALDFSFPPRTSGSLGHNLYDPVYASQHSSLSISQCPCAACSPTYTPQALDHSPYLTALLKTKVGPQEAAHDESAHTRTRAYIHHLLQTHEIGAHVLLTMHNLSIADAFMAGIREELSKGLDAFHQAMGMFLAAHDKLTAWKVLEEGKQWWSKVDKERGKGRLKREKNLEVPAEENS
jgi:queuine/archaeosine tRNA-ribosyltransferase